MEGDRDQRVADRAVAPAGPGPLRPLEQDDLEVFPCVGLDLADLPAAFGEEGVEPVAVKGGVRRDRSERGDAVRGVAGLFAQLASGGRERLLTRIDDAPGISSVTSPLPKRNWRTMTTSSEGVRAITLTQSALSITTASNGADVRGET